jgi:hypothetical protein
VSLEDLSKIIFAGIKISGCPVANASNICVGRHIIRIIVAQLAIESGADRSSAGRKSTSWNSPFCQNRFIA